MRKRDMIVSAVKARIRRMTHKYGIEIPTSIAHAKKLDAANGNNFWIKALETEMFNNGVAFEVLEEGEKAPVGWKKTTGHHPCVAGSSH